MENTVVLLSEAHSVNKGYAAISNEGDSKKRSLGGNARHSGKIGREDGGRTVIVWGDIIGFISRSGSSSVGYRTP